MEKEIKRFTEYEPTKEEVGKIFATEDSYRAWLEVNDERSPLNDSEKNKIAQLLEVRGQKEEARRVLETIENDSYRETCLHASRGWWGSGMNEAGDRITLVN